MENLEVDVPLSTNLSHISPSLKVTHDSPDQICTAIPRYLCCKWLTIIFLALAARNPTTETPKYGEKSQNRFQGPNLLIHHWSEIQNASENDTETDSRDIHLCWVQFGLAPGIVVLICKVSIAISCDHTQPDDPGKTITLLSLFNDWYIWFMWFIGSRGRRKGGQWHVLTTPCTLVSSQVQSRPNSTRQHSGESRFHVSGWSIFSSEMQIKSATKILKVQNFAFFCVFPSEILDKKTTTSPRKTRKSHLDNGESFAEFWVFQSSRLNF